MRPDLDGEKDKVDSRQKSFKRLGKVDVYWSERSDSTQIKNMNITQNYSKTLPLFPLLSPMNKMVKHGLRYKKNKMTLHKLIFRVNQSH